MKIADYVESQIKGLWGTDFDEDGIPVIKTNNLTYEGFIDYSDICKRNIPMEQARQWYLKHGDLLIEKSGGTKTHSVGYVSYFEGENNKYVCNNFILALRLKNTINSKFLFYQIQFKYESNQFSDCFNKTKGIQNLKVKDYLDKEIKVYDAEKQAEIVKELDIIRSVIDKNKQILSKYDTLIKSRFIEMFGDPVVNPKCWKKESIEKYSDIISGYPFDSSKYTETGIKICGGLIIMPNTINWQDCKYWEDFKGFEDYLLEDKDIVIAMDRPWISDGFKIAEITNKDLPVLLIQRTARIRCKTISHTFLFWMFKLGHFDKHCKVTGSLVPHISLKDIKTFEIPIPPIKLQNDFAAFVQQIDKSKFAVQKSLEKAETLYKSLMQEYFG